MGYRLSFYRSCYEYYSVICAIIEAGVSRSNHADWEAKMGKRPKKERITFYAKKEKAGRTNYDDGSTTVTMFPELQQLLREQRRAFAGKFGREPGPDDPLFFDPDADTPQFITERTSDRLIEQLVEAMRKAGVDEAYIYGYTKTGLLVTRENMHLMRPEELKEFEEAVREYQRLKGILDSG
jgi:hypothetical protein